MHLPLDKIATGPADELGLGTGFEAHGCLDTMLQEMKREACTAPCWWLLVCGVRWYATATWRSTPLKDDRSACGGEMVVRAVKQVVTEEPRDDIRVRLTALATTVAETT